MSAFVYLFRASATEMRAAMRPEQAQQSLQAMMAWFKDLEQQGYLKNPGLPLEPSGRVVSETSTPRRAFSCRTRSSPW